MRQLFGDIGWEKKVGVFFISVLPMTVVGPFGTYEDLAFADRLVFWVVVFTGVGFFMHVLMVLALEARHLSELGRFARLALGAAAAAIPGAAVVVFVNGVFRPPMIEAENFAIIWMQVALIGYVIGVVEYIDWRAPSHVPSAPVASADEVRFLKRLPNVDMAAVVSMSMQDHYVQVTTLHGTNLLLMRMSDAVAELDGLDGLQIHRSHWVARQHLVDVKRSRGKYEAHLSDGRVLPISGAHQPKVLAAMQKGQSVPI